MLVTHEVDWTHFRQKSTGGIGLHSKMKGCEMIHNHRI